jgi:hypothetical protein
MGTWVKGEYYFLNPTFRNKTVRVAPFFSRKTDRRQIVFLFRQKNWPDTSHHARPFNQSSVGRFFSEEKKDCPKNAPFFHLQLSEGQNCLI